MGRREAPRRLTCEGFVAPTLGFRCVCPASRRLCGTQGMKWIVGEGVAYLGVSMEVIAQ